MKLHFPITVAVAIAAVSIIHAQINISGTIIDDCGEPLEEVLVRLEGDTIQMDSTTSAGTFNFDITAMGDSFVLRPLKLGGAMSGQVTVKDRILAIDHLLGRRFLDNPYQVIAADLNNNRQFTAADLPAFDDIILGRSERGDSIWCFVPASHVFPDVNDPFSVVFPESVQIPSDSSGVDFVGILKGDVCCMVPTDTTVVRLAVPDTTTCLGDAFSLPVTVSSFNNILGLQFTLGWDTTSLQLDSVGNFGLAGLDSIGFNLSASGYLTFLWSSLNSSDTTLADGTSLFDLYFTAVGVDSSGSSIEILDAPTPFEVVDTGVVSLSSGAQQLSGTVMVNDCPDMMCMFGFDYESNSCGEITFMLTNGGADSLRWDFGDSTFVVDEMNPVHAYDTAGVYEVCLSSPLCPDTFCMQIEIVLDTLAPVVMCPPDSVYQISSCLPFNGAIDYMVTAMDNCDSMVMVTGSHLPGTDSVFVLDSTIVVTYIATDEAGNMAECSFEVRVEQFTPMLDLSCPMSLDAMMRDDCTAMVPEVAVSFSGGCEPYTLMQEPMPGTIVSESTSIIVTVTDSTGQMQSCTVDYLLGGDCPCNEGLEENTFSTTFGAPDSTGLDQTLVAALENEAGDYLTLGVLPRTGTDDQFDLMFGKTDSVGNILSGAKRIQLVDSDTLSVSAEPLSTHFSILADSMGNEYGYVLATSAEGASTGMLPVVARLDTSGCVDWAVRMDGLGMDSASVRGIMTTPDGEIACLLYVEAGIEKFASLLTLDTSGTICNRLDYAPAMTVDGTPAFEPRAMASINIAGDSTISFAIAGAVENGAPFQPLGLLLLDDQFQPVADTLLTYDFGDGMAVMTPFGIAQLDSSILISGFVFEGTGSVKGALLSVQPFVDSMSIGTNVEWARSYVDTAFLFSIFSGVETNSDNGAITIWGEFVRWGRRG